MSTIVILVEAFLLIFQLQEILTGAFEVHNGSSDEKNSNLKTLMLNSYISQTEYEVPTQDALSSSTVLFTRLLSDRNFTQKDVLDWTSLGLHLREVDGFAVVSEFDPQIGKGHGFYTVKLNGPPSGKILQAPHRPSDSYTHEIAFDLLTAENSEFLASAISTTYRDIVDLCKEPDSFFNSFTKASAIAFPNYTKILQLHGFNKVSHNTDADVIFSSSLKEMPEIFHSYAACVKGTLSKEGFNVYKYPEEIDFLGGTLNINAEKMYELNPNGMFFHFEESLPLRERLRVDPELRSKLAACF